MPTALEQLNQIISDFQPGGEVAKRGTKLSDQLRRQLERSGLREQVMAGLSPMGGGPQFEPEATTTARTAPITEQFGRELEAGSTSGLIQAMMSKAGYLQSKEEFERGLKSQRKTQSDITRQLQQLGRIASTKGPESLEYKQLASQLTGMSFTGQVAPSIPTASKLGGYTLQPDYEQIAAKQKVYSGRSIPGIQF